MPSQPRMRFRPGDMEAASPARTQLLDRYEAWLLRRQPGLDVVDTSELGMLLDWKVTYGDGKFDVWTIDEVDEFLLGWCPRKLSATPDEAREVPPGVAGAFNFLSDEQLLSPDSAPGNQLAAHARSLADIFLDRMNDPANFGMGKSLFGSMGLGGLGEEITQERLDEAVAAFNALPFEQRKAITDAGLGAGGAGAFPLSPGDWDDEAAESDDDTVTLGPIRMPSAEQIRESAASAPVLHGFATLAEYFTSPGRPLTEKGNIKLADAEALADLLGTETRQGKVGDFQFSRQSSTRMPNLDHWQWWAREVGALRVRKNKMVGVEAWRRRFEADPLSEARKSYQALSTYGPLNSFHTWFSSSTYDLVDDMAGPLLAVLLTSDEPTAYQKLRDIVMTAAEQHPPSYAYPHEFLGARDFVRDEADEALDRWLSLQERAGVVVQADVAHEPRDPFEHRRVGGTVHLTPFGVLMGVEEVRRQGVEVQELPSAETLDATSLARLAIDQVVMPEDWLGLVDDWMALGDDRHDALEHVVRALDDEGAALTMLLLPTPARLADELTVVMRRLADSQPASDNLSAVAISWLLQNGKIDPAEVPFDQYMAAGFVTLGLLALDDPESVPGVVAEGRSEAEQLRFIEEIGRRMPLHAVALLEAIDHHHADKVIRKAARKELFRVRSRLASQRL